MQENIKNTMMRIDDFDEKRKNIKQQQRTKQQHTENHPHGRRDFYIQLKTEMYISPLELEAEKSA